MQKMCKTLVSSCRISEYDFSVSRTGITKFRSKQRRRKIIWEPGTEWSSTLRTDPFCNYHRPLQQVQQGIKHVKLAPTTLNRITVAFFRRGPHPNPTQPNHGACSSHPRRQSNPAPPCRIRSMQRERENRNPAKSHTEKKKKRQPPLLLAVSLGVPASHIYARQAAHGLSSRLSSPPYPCLAACIPPRDELRLPPS